MTGSESARAQARRDPGLGAVARVRGVRERDARVGLQRALEMTRRRESEAARAHRQVGDAAAFGAGTTAAFLASRTTLAAMAGRAGELESLAASSRATTEEARGRWQLARTGLRVTEVLLERRAEAALAEARRRDARELDDLAGRLWLRRRALGDDNGGQTGGQP